MQCVLHKCLLVMRVLLQCVVAVRNCSMFCTRLLIIAGAIAVCVSLPSCMSPYLLNKYIEFQCVVAVCCCIVLLQSGVVKLCRRA